MARTLTGIVVSDKATKTIVVSVATSKTHPLYKKQYSRSKKFLAHDEKEEAGIGDKVRIQECRPLSARKHFMLLKVLEKAALTQADLVENIATKDTEEATP